jgi:hypothetical protein
MGTFNIISSTLNSQFSYVNMNVVITGSYAADAQTNALQNINGQAYLNDGNGGQGDYIGNFNGFMRNGQMKYSLSEMTRQNADLVLDALAEIEQEIIGTNTEE